MTPLARGDGHAGDPRPLAGARVVHPHVEHARIGRRRRSRRPGPGRRCRPGARTRPPRPPSSRPRLPSPPRRPPAGGARSWSARSTGPATRRSRPSWLIRTCPVRRPQRREPTVGDRYVVPFFVRTVVPAWCHRCAIVDRVGTWCGSVHPSPTMSCSSRHPGRGRTRARPSPYPRRRRRPAGRSSASGVPQARGDPTRPTPTHEEDRQPRRRQGQRACGVAGGSAHRPGAPRRPGLVPRAGRPAPPGRPAARCPGVIPRPPLSSVPRRALAAVPASRRGSATSPSPRRSRAPRRPRSR